MIWLSAAAVLLLAAGIWTVLAAMDVWPFRAISRIESIDSLRRLGNVQRRAPRFVFRRHWGSFGGESTGWEMSPNMVRLLVGVAMMSAGIWLLLIAINGTAWAPSSAAVSKPDATPAAKASAVGK